MSSPIHIALIGCGSIGEAHAECLSQIEDAKVVAYCDINEMRAKYLQEKFNGLYCTTDVKKIFHDDTIQAVYICTTTDTHHDIAVQAAKAGKHIMIEKPLALTMKECYDVGHAVEKHRVKLMTAFKLRFYPSTAKAKQFISNPIVTIAQFTDQQWPHDFWGNDPVKGGGNVLSQGCHAVDLIYYLNQSEPKRIYAEGGNYTHRTLKIIDNIVATIWFENGAVASVVVGDSGETPVVSKFSFQILDGVRTAHLHDRLLSLTMFDGETVTEHHDAEEFGLIEEDKAFVHALQNNLDPPTTYFDGLRATAIITKAFDSIRKGKPQDIHL